MLSTRQTRYVFRRAILCVFSAVFLLNVCSSQTGDENAKDVLRLSEAQQEQFVESVLEASFPEKVGDRFSILLVNRSALVVPMVEARVEQELKRSSRSERFIDLASAMVTYPGDEQSLRAVSKLVMVDENRFGPLVGRTLDNAGNWGNPFTVAYKGLTLGDESLSRRIAEWAESALASTRMQRVWAEAMLDKYATVPDESVWATDTLASRLKDRASPDLRQNVRLFATETQSKRGKR